MELDYTGFQKSRLIELADEIHKSKGQKQQLELELASEEFHKSYIPKRKKMIEGRLKSAIPLIIIIAFLTLFSVMLISYYILNSVNIRENTAMGTGFDPQNAAMGLGVLAGSLMLVLCVFIGHKLFKEGFGLLVRLFYSFSPERAMRFAKKHEISTFQDDEIRCDKRIAFLQEQISALDEKISLLENEQNELIEQAKKKEDVLKKYGVIRDEKDENNNEKRTFKLKEPEIGGGDIVELFDFYSKEESFINYIINDLNIKIANIDKEIVMIDDDFEKMKKRVFIFVGIIAVAAIIQNAFSGFMAYVSAAICFIIGLVAALGLERFCYAPTIRYLTEHEHPIMSEYAFVNNIVPARRRREELVQRLRQQEEALDDISKKKSMLDV